MHNYPVDRHPSYVIKRIREVGKNFRLRLLLLLVDIEDNVIPLQELNKLCFVHEFTLLLSWTILEAARYLETYKAYEHKPPTAIQERTESDFLPRVTKTLTSSIKSINKTDVATLFSVFGTLEGICAADEQQLLLCPGLGEKKVRRLFQALHEPFHAKRQGATTAISTTVVEESCIS